MSSSKKVLIESHPDEPSKKDDALIPPVRPLPHSPPPPYTQSTTPTIGSRSRAQPYHEFHRYPGLSAPLGPHPARILCPFCGADVVTGTSPRPGLMAYVACTALFCIGCVWGCCLIPFCLEPFQDVDHVCPNCRRIVYRYRGF